VNDPGAAAALGVAPLSTVHDRAAFACGVDSLDRYLKTQAGQDVRRKVNAVFVLAESANPAQILGYYTLCATALGQGEVPDAARRHVPRYPLVSATLIGRLAVSRSHQGAGLGGVLLADALRRRAWSWWMRWTKRRRPSMRRTASSVYRTRPDWSCRCGSLRR
jgi:GNAT superfamily N-acetyltransferase